MEVGFVGLGRMGRAMVRNLIAAGHQVSAWNRSGPPSEPIDGLRMTASPQAAFQAEAVFTMLSDDPAIREILLVPGVLGQARPGVVHVVTATISTAFADELRAAHAAAGIGYVSAPVFGRPDVAEAAQLKIMAAGERAAVERVRPLLEAVGDKLWVLGDDPKQANAAKIAGNMMIATAIESLAEAAALTRGNGLDPAIFFDLILEAQFGGSRAYANYSAKILNGDYEAGFLLRLGLKDLGLAVAAGERSGRDLPQLKALHAQMSAADASGMGERDWSALADYTLNG